jgi:hypothetical protein
MAPDKMKKYERDTKWNILWQKIEGNIVFYNSLYFIVFISN